MPAWFRPGARTQWGPRRRRRGSGIPRTPHLPGCFCTAGETPCLAGAVGWAQPVRLKPLGIQGSRSDELRAVWTWVLKTLGLLFLTPPIPHSHSRLKRLDLGCDSRKVQPLVGSEAALPQGTEAIPDSAQWMFVWAPVWVCLLPG